MHRNHVWTSILRRILTLQVFTLLICAPAAWSQKFGTNVNAGAITCGGTKKHNQDGELLSSDQAYSVCVTAPADAAATSTADLYGDTTSAGGVDLAGPSSGYAGFITYDTVTPFPRPISRARA